MRVIICRTLKIRLCRVQKTLVGVRKILLMFKKVKTFAYLNNQFGLFYSACLCLTVHHKRRPEISYTLVFQPPFRLTNYM